MQAHITSHTVANQVRMGSQVFHGAYCVVEGQSDVDFYRYFFNVNDCRFIPAMGKDKALAAMQCLNNDRFHKAFSILDADFMPISKNEVKEGNVFFTDTHDSETLVIKSDAFKKTLNNYSDTERLEQFIQSLGKNDLRDVLLISGLQIGRLRLLNEDRGYSLNFKSLYLDQFVDSSTLKLDIEGLAKNLIQTSRRQNLNAAQLLEELKAYENQEHDPWLVVCGHDLVKLLVSGLKKIFGRDNYSPNEWEIERGLRQAFEAAHFTKTQLYKKIKQWSENELGRRVLTC